MALIKLRAISFLLLFSLHPTSANTETALSNYHGTVVFTLVQRDGFVMASDGLTIQSVPDGKGGYKPVRLEAKPKISVCGHVFLCGMAGQNPIHDSFRGVKVDYEFKDWISRIPDAASPELFAKAISRAAVRTFKRYGIFLKNSYFWHMPSAETNFARYQVAGYDRAGKPQVCSLSIDVDQIKNELVYQPVKCEPLKLIFPTPTTFEYYPLSVWGNSVDQATHALGSREELFLHSIIRNRLQAVQAIEIEVSSALKSNMAVAASLILVEDKFHCDKAGGPTSVGVLQKGREPKVVRFPEL